MNAAPIAVIGMAARTPQADDLTGYWNLLASGRQTIGPLPPGRLHDYRPEVAGVATPHLSLLPEVDQFEPELFGITPRMAAWMDPQQRLMLEATWHALECAGLAPESVAGRDVAVFVSTTSSDMRDVCAAEHAVHPYSAVGLLLTFVANRISHQFDLRGPSMTVDTACAGGLTAVGQAVAGLRAGDFPMAIAGSPNVYLHGHMQAVMQRFGALSPSGQVRCFGADADGYARGEGAFCFILKLLDDALTAGDPVLAVIRGTAQSHDGRRGGLVKSDPDAQVELIGKALNQAGLAARELGYLEAHAAGTAKGDPIEVAAAVRLLRTSGARAAAGPHGRFWIGSVKANIGHLEGGAGSASLAKAIQILRYRMIPATPGIGKLHPDIPADRDPVDIARIAMAWESDQPRRLGVNAFGVGGANAHVVLEEGPALPAPPLRKRSTWLVPVSARTEASLRRLAEALASLTAEGSVDPAGGPGLAPPDFAALVWTLQSGRSTLRCRVLIEAAGPAEFVLAARAVAHGRSHPAVRREPAAEDADGLGNRWLAGEPVDWNMTWPDPARPRRIPLVPYPFDRRRHWPDLGAVAGERAPPSSARSTGRGKAEAGFLP